jgi:hypothetical protein
MGGGGACNSTYNRSLLGVGTYNYRVKDLAREEPADACLYRVLSKAVVGTRHPEAARYYPNFPTICLVVSIRDYPSALRLLSGDSDA